MVHVWFDTRGHTHKKLMSKDHTSNFSEHIFDNIESSKFLWNISYSNQCVKISKKSSKLIFCAFPAHCRAPAEPTYDFYICLPQLFAAHSCFPQLPATPRSTAAHQQPLVLRGAAGNCGKSYVPRKAAEKTLVPREFQTVVPLKKTLVSRAISWCAKMAMVCGEREKVCKAFEVFQFCAAPLHFPRTRKIKNTFWPTISAHQRLLRSTTVWNSRGTNVFSAAFRGT